MDFVDTLDTLGTKHFVLNGIIVIWAKINTSSNDLSCLLAKFLGGDTISFYRYFERLKI